jgi:hypothetical protein
MNPFDDKPFSKIAERYLQQIKQLREVNAELLEALKTAHARMHRYGICINAIENAITKAEAMK